MIINRKDVFVYLILSLSLPLFFYNLGGYSLADFDEAWFADVARNILLSKNPLILSFNNNTFLEHPPLGFLLMALSFLMFGMAEFTARFPSALFGFLSLFIVYGIGKNLFNRAIGLGASCMLLSCVWFLFRARSGNLDTIFLFFYLLSFYAALMLKKNSKYVYALAIALSGALLSKMLIGVTILLPIALFFFIEKIVLPKRKIVQSLLLFLLLTAPYFIANFLNLEWFFVRHVFLVGLRPFGRIFPNFHALFSEPTFLYLRYGIWRWYYPALIATVGTLPLIVRFKRLLPIYALVGMLLFSFLTNSKTEIWHLIVLYPFLGIIIAFLLYHLSLFVIRKTYIRKLPISSTQISSLFVVISMMALSFGQIYLSRNDIRLFEKGVSSLAFTAGKASQYKEPLYLYADYFLPSTVFYSGKPVAFVRGQNAPRNTLSGIIRYGEKPFLLLGEKWKFDLDHIDPKSYTKIAEHNEYMLVRVE